jgi:hypothetical protein
MMAINCVAFFHPMTAVSGNMVCNNTPQAYPVASCREAQTGGFIHSRICHAL